MKFEIVGRSVLRRPRGRLHRELLRDLVRPVLLHDLLHLVFQAQF
jgi:hypothetical protein